MGTGGKEEAQLGLELAWDLVHRLAQGPDGDEVVVLGGDTSSKKPVQVSGPPELRSDSTAVIFPQHPRRWNVQDRPGSLLFP